MTSSFSLADSLAAADMQVYLSRAARVEDGSVRLIAASTVLAAYVAVLYPRGLLDRTPTVLGLRTLATGQDASFDVVVPIRSMLDRLVRIVPDGAGGEASRGEEDAPVEVSLPTQPSAAAWAGISPPRGGWAPVGDVPASTLDATATEGIAEVAAAIPEGTGEQLVHRVRSEVWGRAVPSADAVPAGAAFAAHSLGFLGPGDEPVTIYENGPWSRLTSRRGHVLVHGWSRR